MYKYNNQKYREIKRKILNIICFCITFLGCINLFVFKYNQSLARKKELDVKQEIENQSFYLQGLQKSFQLQKR